MPPTTRVAVTLLGLAVLAGAQDPYKVAADHYHLAFENQWARATRVTYQPHDTAPTHGHPPTPTTVYVYVTDGGAIRFRHVTGEHVAGVEITRKPVQAGAIRFAHGAPRDAFGGVPRGCPDRVRAHRTPYGAARAPAARRAAAARR